MALFTVVLQSIVPIRRGMPWRVASRRGPSRARRMMRSHRPIRMGSLALAAFALVAAAAAQSKPEAYIANASLKTAGGAALTAPVTITIAGWTSDAERSRLSEVLKSGGDPALLQQLAGMKTLGTITVGAQQFDAKYAYALASSEGRIITVVTGRPIFFVGAGAPDAKPKGHHDFGVVTIEVNDKGVGKGTLTPAANLRVSESGALIVEDYSVELVTLPDVKKK
jgi:hypothetical protein